MPAHNDEITNAKMTGIKRNIADAQQPANKQITLCENLFAANRNVENAPRMEMRL